MLSRSLFNLYKDDILKKAGKLAGLNINGRTINNLRFADDTELLRENEQQLQDLVNQTIRNNADCRLDVNINKTKTMVIDNENGRVTMNITVSGEILEQVMSFLYLVM